MRDRIPDQRLKKMRPRRKEWVRTRYTGLLYGVEVLRCFSGGQSPEERRRLSESRRLEGFPSSAGRNSGSGLTTSRASWSTPPSTVGVVLAGNRREHVH